MEKGPGALGEIPLQQSCTFYILQTFFWQIFHRIALSLGIFWYVFHDVIWTSANMLSRFHCLYVSNLASILQLHMHPAAILLVWCFERSLETKFNI